jgi:hypothetical protein
MRLTDDEIRAEHRRMIDALQQFVRKLDHEFPDVENSEARAIKCVTYLQLATLLRVDFFALSALHRFAYDLTAKLTAINELERSIQ